MNSGRDIWPRKQRRARPCCPREVREDVRGADRDAEGHVERAEALLEEDVERAGREDAAHGAALDDEGHASGLAGNHGPRFFAIAASCQRRSRARRRRLAVKAVSAARRDAASTPAGPRAAEHPAAAAAGGGLSAAAGAAAVVTASSPPSCGERGPRRRPRRAGARRSPRRRATRAPPAGRRPRSPPRGATAGAASRSRPRRTSSTRRGPARRRRAHDRRRPQEVVLPRGRPLGHRAHRDEEVPDVVAVAVARTTSPRSGSSPTATMPSSLQV